MHGKEVNKSLHGLFIYQGSIIQEISQEYEFLRLKIGNYYSIRNTGKKKKKKDFLSLLLFSPELGKAGRQRGNVSQEKQ